ncbi:MAG TPA: hypothetical protein VK780_00090, partial [Thermoanaerobaculia bacterium]|nr:hypothetical protein [Thermoanaerobaculia bacterium]
FHADCRKEAGADCGPDASDAPFAVAKPRALPDPSFAHLSSSGEPRRRTLADGPAARPSKSGFERDPDRTSGSSERRPDGRPHTTPRADCDENSFA